MHNVPSKGKPRSRAFTLLYALLVLTILLGISTSAISLLLKQSQLVTFGQTSEQATYLAESGAECILSFVLQNNLAGAQCDGSTPVVTVGGDGRSTYTVQLQKGCAAVTVDTVNHYVESRGYNQACTSFNASTAQRGIRISYTPPVAHGGGSGGGGGTGAYTDPDLEANWLFDEGSGNTVADFSANQNKGTRLGGPSWVSGQDGYALLFNAASQSVEVPDDDSLDFSSADPGITITAWIKPNSISGNNHPILSKKCLGGGTGYLFKETGDELYFGYDSDGTGHDATSANVNLTTGTWTHVAVTFNNSQIKFYKNANLTDTFSKAGSMGATTNEIQIGAMTDACASTAFFDGAIDSLRIYRRALSQTDIQGIYNTTGDGGSTSDTTAPSVPTNPAATAISTSQINFSWTASTDADSGIANYVVQRCTGAGCTSWATTSSPIGTTLNDTGLTTGTTYLYRVRAVDNSGNMSAFSGVASATTGSTDGTPPSVPTNLKLAGDTKTRVDISWTASTDSGSGVGVYTVQRCLGSGCTSWATTSGPITNANSDTGLTAGSVYRYRVRAVDNSGNMSAFTAPINTMTISTTNLISEWQFETNASDSVGSNDGTLSGTASLSTTRHIGAKAVSFGATNGYVNTTNISQMNNAAKISVSGWFRDPTPGSATWRYLFAKYVNGTADFQVAVGGSGKMNVDIGNGSADTYGSWTGYGGAIPANTWYHVVLVYDGTQSAANRIKLYVNNTARTLALTGTIPATTEPLATPFRLGSNGTAGSYFTNGFMDQVRLYNRALSVQEVDSLYNELP